MFNIYAKALLTATRLNATPTRPVTDARLPRLRAPRTEDS